MTDTSGPLGGDLNGSGSTAQQRDTAATPSPSPGGQPLTISFTADKLRYLETEIERLSQYAVICRLVGSMPNRGELKDLIYGKLLLEGSSLTNIQLMGKGFYLIEFEKIETAKKLITMNPLDLRSARAFFSPWKQGFNAAKAAKKGDRIFKITAIIPNLPKEYVPLLPVIGQQLGIPLESEDTLATRISKANGMPSINCWF